MKFLWFTWKDLAHPLAGGAEVENEEIAARLCSQGHEVTFVVGGFQGGKEQETIKGYKVIRVGGALSVYWKAYRYYKKHLVGWADVIIEEINTIPFFTSCYAKEKNILLYHQLCRKVWFYQMIFPLNVIGYTVEPIYVWLLRKNKIITISESSKRDLMRYGYKSQNINIIPMGIEIDPCSNPVKIKKFDEPTVLSLGAIRAMKRPDHQIRAFEIAKESIPELKLKIAGGGKGRYFERVMAQIKSSKYASSIEYLGRITIEKKIELMGKSHLILVTSVKEGWGLIVTEANSQGTPAVVYDIDGLRDSTKDGITGVVIKENTPVALAKELVKLLRDKERYNKMAANAYNMALDCNFKRSSDTFLEIVKKYLK